MVYSNHFVMCVLLRGEPVKEKSNGTVDIPFGSEYQLRLRNKNNRRAVVKIYIDGENVSGGGYVIEANSFIDIKRHHDKDRAFKFVSLDSAEAVDFGKNGPNPEKIKGTIEARFHLEKERHVPLVQEIHHHHHHDHIYPPPAPLKPSPWIRPPIWVGGYYKNTTNSGPISYTSGLENAREEYTQTCGFDCDSDRGYAECSAGGASASRPKTRGRVKCNPDDIATFKRISTPAAPPLQDGCTVEGYNTGQSFYSVTMDYEDTYTSLKVFLQGYEAGEPGRQETQTVAEPVRKTNKDLVIDDLERENEELRRKLAEAENRRLKEKLKELED